MPRIPALFVVLAASLALLQPARAAGDQQVLVDSAYVAVEHIHDSQDPVAGKARELLHTARAVLIVPELVKGGFFVGAQGGNALLVARDAQGQWGEPGFYIMGAASFGLQIGVEVSQVVLIIMNDKALNAVMKNEFKFGAEAGLALATLGAGAEANTTSNAGADIYGFSISKGLFGGIAVSGGIIHPRNGWAAAYYGEKVSSAAIVRKNAATNPGADTLRKALAGM
jgi:lipid-binding SYLF domain-containing protein